jgi:hypothetical protein
VVGVLRIKSLSEDLFISVLLQDNSRKNCIIPQN